MHQELPSPNGIAVTQVFDSYGRARGLLAFGMFASILLVCASGIAQPKVTSISTPVGFMGSTVTITGTSFNTTPANNTVYFGATQATVTTASTTSLTVTVPSGTTYERVSVTDNATSLTGCSPQAFLQNYPGGDTGVISFEGRVDFATGASPSGIAIGDVDGDGKPDIVVANTVAKNISVYRNLSAVPGAITSATFAAPVTFSTGAISCYMIALGDLDGDGKLDIAAGAQTGNQVLVFRNSSVVGTPLFSGLTLLTAASLPYSVAIGDIDGDGKLDLLSANNGGNNFSAFRNTSVPGTISFTPSTNFSAGIQPSCIAIQDIDGDGKADVAVTNYGSNNLQIFRNTAGTGAFSATTFAAAASYPTTGPSPQSVLIGDIDGDGKADIIVGTKTAPSRIQIFRNTSTPGTMTIASATTQNAKSIEGMAIGDFDGDGMADIIVTNIGDTSVSIFRNSSTVGTFSFAPQVLFTSLMNPAFTAVGDIDGDGRSDIAFTNFGTNQFSILRNGTTPTTSTGGIFPSGDDVSIFPNPTNGDLTIAIQKDVYQSFAVTNSIGQLLLQQTLNGEQTTVNVRTLPAGLYYIMLKGDGGSLVRKFVKL